MAFDTTKEPVLHPMTPSEGPSLSISPTTPNSQATAKKTKKQLLRLVQNLRGDIKNKLMQAADLNNKPGVANYSTMFAQGVNSKDKAYDNIAVLTRGTLY